MARISSTAEEKGHLKKMRGGFKKGDAIRRAGSMMENYSVFMNGGHPRAKGK